MCIPKSFTKFPPHGFITKIQHKAYKNSQKKLQQVRQLMFPLFLELDLDIWNG